MVCIVAGAQAWRNRIGNGQATRGTGRRETVLPFYGSRGVGGELQPSQGRALWRSAPRMCTTVAWR
jgi:hypothetical protein